MEIRRAQLYPRLIGMTSQSKPARCVARSFADSNDELKDVKF